MKQLEVQIMGQSYLLSCPENGDARLLEAVSRVDAAMCKIRDAGKTKARDRIAVLAALNLAFELAEHSANGVSAQGQAPATFAGPAEDASDPNLAALLQRLNTTLGTDGRLL